MVYEIASKQLYPANGSSYEAHGVKENQRIGFLHNGNMLFGIVVGCGKNTLLVQVDILSF